jgi:hypothetical protein
MTWFLDLAFLEQLEQLDLRGYDDATGASAENLDAPGPSESPRRAGEGGGARLIRDGLHP